MNCAEKGSGLASGGAAAVTQPPASFLAAAKQRLEALLLGR
jgi:hypothetical protein